MARVNTSSGGGISSPVPIADGGTAATTAASARQNLAVWSRLGRVGYTENLGITLSGGVLTLTQADASAIADTDGSRGYIVCPSTTAGQVVTLAVKAPFFFNDDVNASSDLTNWGTGITEAVAWAEDMPWFLYAVNRGNTDFSGTDGESTFCITRNPCMTTTPAAANDIGDTGAIPVNDTEHTILILDDVTVANYVSLPCVLIGGFRMRWSAVNTDWTVQALAATDGIGETALRKLSSTYYVMPLNQHGASATTHLLPNGGTAPLFSTRQYHYKVSLDGSITVEVNFGADGGTDGAGAVQAQLSLPTRLWRQAAANSYIAHIGECQGATTITAGANTSGEFGHGLRYVGLAYYSAAVTRANITNAMFSAGGRSIVGKFTYQGFSTTP